jgi:hypothetical protein
MATDHRRRRTEIMRHAVVNLLVITATSLNVFQVLAYRGQHWTLVQNGARTLWNCLHTAMLRALTLGPEGEEEGLLTMGQLTELAWHPLYVVTDCLLDMLYQQEEEFRIQASKVSSMIKNRK